MKNQASKSARKNEFAKIAGYEFSRFNALKHGVLSRHTLLPWEDESEYQALLGAMVREHRPSGPTEEHLVEELAGILWRKQRLRLAENALMRRGLKEAIRPFNDTVETALAHLDTKAKGHGVLKAVRSDPKSARQEFHDLEGARQGLWKALECLEGAKLDAYQNALTLLPSAIREEWEYALSWDTQDCSDDEEPYEPDAESLSRYFETEMSDWYETRRSELENRPLIRSQVLGEAFDPDRLAQLARYEVHFDRKLERMLAMLMKLQDVRRSVKPT